MPMSIASSAGLQDDRAAVAQQLHKKKPHGVTVGPNVLADRCRNQQTRRISA